MTWHRPGLREILRRRRLAPDEVTAHFGDALGRVEQSGSTRDLERAAEFAAWLVMTEHVGRRETVVNELAAAAAWCGIPEDRASAVIDVAYRRGVASLYEAAREQVRR